MRIRQQKKHMTISARVSKQEWEEIKAAADKMFAEREVGYINIGDNLFNSTTHSPYFKDMKGLDDQGKLKSAEQEIIDKQVAEEIKNKGGI